MKLRIYNRRFVSLQFNNDEFPVVWVNEKGKKKTPPCRREVGVWLMHWTPQVGVVARRVCK